MQAYSASSQSRDTPENNRAYCVNPDNNGVTGIPDSHPCVIAT